MSQLTSWYEHHLRAALPEAVFRASNASATAWSVAQWRLDSRQIMPGDGFLAFQGTQVDGHDYVQAAHERGASLAIVQQFQDVDIPQVKVNAVQDALWCLARYVRQCQQDCCFVALTGSVGKSSTRSLLHAALSCFSEVYSSIGNLNNHLGMPLCLANMGPEATAKVGVFEMGMNHAGEIAPLSRLLCPHIALVLNVAPVHIENFANLAGIAKAKAEIYAGLTPSGHALIPAGEFAGLMAQDVVAQTHTILDEQAAYHWQDAHLSCRVLQQSWPFSAKIRLQRFSHNILAVFEVAGLLFGHQPDLIVRMLAALEAWHPEAGRGKISTLCLRGKDITLLDDGYNASVLSMLAMITQLAGAEVNGRKIAVLGEMKELGNYSPIAHDQVSEAVLQAMQQNKIDQVYYIGSAFARCLGVSAEIKQYDCPEQLATQLADAVQQGDMIAIKGSFAVGLHRLPTLWQNLAQD